MTHFARTLPMDESLTDISVLVVDDEPSIRKTLEGVLEDEGYHCSCAASGAQALEYLREQRPHLVLLDIWMPGLDGLETLEQIHEIYPDLPVIMISGHATIATAVKATKMGASEFIEKPLDLNAMLETIRRVLHGSSLSNEESEGEEMSQDEREALRISASQTPLQIDPIVFHDQKLRGKSLQQRTIAHSAILYGQGLHSGKKSGLMFEPLPAHSGIHFVGVSYPSPVPAHVDFVESTGFATTLKLGQTQVATIEHLMSALCAYGISNLLIKCNDEVPVLDGSALEVCRLLDETGVEEQSGEWYAIKIEEPVRVGDDKEFILIEPAEEFSISYRLSYPEPLGVQEFSFALGDKEAYQREIAPARTFGFLKDIEYLQQQGLAQGGRFDNFVLYGPEGSINGELRFENEAVRHKILDAIGDLYLLGRPIQGKITASMTGHSDNIEILRVIRDLLEGA
ncbi:MAG: UDP-3-O-[3-hydroxymyristoyl] N-acetylglucosamine deacetylase [Bdellovibrionales bacterium]|nr:UDP-3-O-[3-hydroxymyristoyl] N-acetylglucosamine deacetylase [Bdellovibrionales bacterium]